MTLADAAWAALAQVRDPELDRPITELGFVARLTAEAGAVRAELRLPTYFCAPNFAWLMVADARDALAALPGAGPVEVVLLDHFVAAEINAGVAAAGDFAGTFAGDADPGTDPALAGLRTTFERKAHLAAQERLACALVGAGADPAALSTLSFAAAARAAPEAVARRRARLGLTSEHALCDDEGAALPADRLPGWLRFARTVRVSIDGNAGFCQGLLRTRYG
ncbi:iron-sulfur cluster assembly protein [Actinoplanes sp. NPDC049599]|uniref:iron-sulfur cluster assembly protein n=1 Tax=Actinoplanes sp. NPDC049599 TaxID=3363903 RepID=UPI00378A0B72